MTKAELIKSMKPFVWEHRVNAYIAIHNDKEIYDVWQDGDIYTVQSEHSASYLGKRKTVELAKQQCWEWHVENVLSNFNLEE